MERATGVDPKRLVAIFYVFAAIVLGVFLEKLAEVGLSFARFNDQQVLWDLTWSDLVKYASYAVAAGAALVVWRNPRAQTVSLEVAGELKKVTWPSLRETRAATVAVVVATFVAAIILGLFDFIWARLSTLIY
ncbi:MAG: preprotein translocase subunit SecE [Deltaproteobacteria bacterium]|nr:preprotein translocase subunit SecE [Deltaproteobacteria bacterium]